MKPNDVYSRLFEEVRGRQRWVKQPDRWYSDKGLIVIDAFQRHPKLAIGYTTLATARFELRGKDRQLLSVDIQWGDKSESPNRTYSRPFYEFLLSRASGIERTIRTQTGMPGIVRVNEDAARANWMMEAGFVYEDGLDLLDPARFDEYVSWLVTVAPVARNQWIMAVNAYARERGRWTPQEPGSEGRPPSTCFGVSSDSAHTALARLSPAQQADWPRHLGIVVPS
jgi:hypothetical protein